MRVRDKIGTFMLVTSMILAMLLIYHIPNGKDGNWLIPMGFMGW